ncbi:methyltransferase domain-containing protein [Actinomadura sp. GC306]|nr:methyltransferase domain-containing protein [Actinomadura sp. GC306]
MSARTSEPTIASLRDISGEGTGGALARYWTFYWAVAAAQLTRWLPRRPSRVLDISGGRSAAQAAAARHTVLEVIDPARGDGRRTPDARPVPDGPVADVPVPDGAPRAEGGTIPIIGDTGSLTFLAGGSVDAVIAENRVLSRHLATEATVAEIARVLRPGGRVLLCVDSLTLGMALLAERNYWAHLSDVPSAEVVLIPWPDGRITRSFSSHQLRELLGDAGLEVEWIRPRTVLSPSTVEHVLAESPRALSRLVRTELTATEPDESLGVHLLASARRK